MSTDPNKKPFVKIVSDGTPFGSKVLLVTDDGEINISKCVRNIRLEHEASKLPIVCLELIFSKVEAVAELKSAIAALADVTGHESQFREVTLL